MKAQPQPLAASQCERGGDRRTHNAGEPPPFMTRDGLVDVERRSPFDRRANWLREFAIDLPATLC